MPSAPATAIAGVPMPKSPPSAAIDATFSQHVTTVTQADAAVPLLRVAAVKAPFGPGQAVWWNGLVGATVDSNGRDMAVLPVWDVRSRILAVVEGTNARGMVAGTGQRQECRVDYLSRSDEVRVGDRMVTSDPTRTIPNGLLICTVSLVKRRDDGVYQLIACDSAIDIGALTQVLLDRRSARLPEGEAVAG